MASSIRSLSPFMTHDSRVWHLSFSIEFGNSRPQIHSSIKENNINIRKLAELGYSRSGRKCKEKFENVHKYYKRTKEGRAGRQDGKTYRFFSQLEALHSGTNLPSSATASVSMTMGMVGSSARIQPLNSDSSNPNNTTTTHVVGVPRISPPPDLSGGGGAHTTPIAATTATANTAGISFSSDTSSDSEDELEQGPSNTNTRKRKRGSSSSSGKNKMMAFFEGLMKQVMEKQEAMQQRFLDTIDKREQDRLIREEAWKRQEMARLTHEHEIIAQERAISASRDAAIIAFLQKITGQTIQLPPPIVIPAAPPPKSTPPPPPPQPQPQPQPQIHQLQQQQHHQQPQNKEIIRHQPTSSEVVVAAVPEQQYPPQEMGGGSGGFDPTSSRWPKVEVLALIKLRSGLDSRYQEAGPKGPLWEEISAGMQRMGYNRSAKRCKEKWENINKYFKKVKESNKKRPEDAKTCPYFHQLDALYRKKMSSSSSSTNLIGNQCQQEQQLMDSSSTIDPTSTEKLQAIVITPQPPPQTQTGEAENNNGGNMEMKNSSNEGLFEEGGTTGLMKKPEDIMKELMMEHHHPQLSVMDAYDKLEEPQSSDVNLDQDEDDEDDEDDDDEEVEEENGKMDYKIQFQRQNTAGSSNGGGNTGGGSFLAMVQ